MMRVLFVVVVLTLQGVVGAATGAIFEDDMESGEGGWTGNAPWGLTTSSSHSPTHSWTDSPGGNYANDSNVSLATPAMDFSGLTAVSLTFWHRYELEEGFDFGRVWVTTDNSATFTKVQEFTGVSSWSQTSVNLDEYAGKPSVKIYFQLFSNSSVVMDGWYVDDVQVATRVEVFADDMESGEGGWTRNAPWGLTTSSSHSPTHSWTDSPGGNYANDSNVSLATPAMDFSGLTAVSLTFWHRYELEEGFDFARVWVTTDNDATFTKVQEFTGVSSWNQTSVNLDEYAGKPSVKIYFQLFSNSGVVMDGWYVDDVVVTGVSPDAPASLAASRLVFIPPARGMSGPLLVGGAEGRGPERGPAFQLFDMAGNAVAGQFALSPDFGGVTFARNSHILVGGRETAGSGRGAGFQLFDGAGNLETGNFVLNSDFTGVEYHIGDIAGPGVLVCGVETKGEARGPAFQIFDSGGNLTAGGFALNGNFSLDNQCLVADLDGVTGDEVIVGGRMQGGLGPAYQVWDRNGNLLFGRLVLNADFSEVRFGVADIASNGVFVVGRETGGLARGPALQLFDGGGALLAGAFVLTPDFTGVGAFGANTTNGVSGDDIVVVGRETGGPGRGSAFQIWDRFGNMVLGRFVLNPDFTEVKFTKIDINNDGLDEILVVGRETGGLARGPAVQAWDGTGNLLASFFVLNGDFTNLSIFAIDQDGDGDEEIGVGGTETGGEARGPAYQIFESDGTPIVGRFVLNADFGPVRRDIRMLPTGGPSGTRVVIEGDGFSEESVATFDGIAAETLFVSGIKLVAFVPFAVEGSAPQPLEARTVEVAVDGNPGGSFAVEGLPENPYPPGVVWDTFSTDLNNNFPALRADLEARTDELLTTVTDPTLLDLLNAVKNALPEIESQLAMLGNLRNDLTPGQLALLERALFKEGVAPSSSAVQTQSVDANILASTLDSSCTAGTRMDQQLCKRIQGDEQAKDIGLATKLCAIISTGLLIQPEIGLPLADLCLGANSIASVVKMYLFNKDIVGVEVSGPETLNAPDTKTYSALVTLEDRTSLDGLFEVVEAFTLHKLKVPSGALKTVIQTLVNAIIAVADIDFPELGDLNSDTDVVSSENFDWDVTGIDPRFDPPQFASVDEAGAVTVEDPGFIENATIQVSAYLADEFLTREEWRERYRRLDEEDLDDPLGCKVAPETIGCQQVTVIPPGFLSVGIFLDGTQGEGGTVNSSPAGISDCRGPSQGTCLAAYQDGKKVTLTATADSGFKFSHWTGACSGATCEVTVGGGSLIQVNAIFDEQTPLEGFFQGSVFAVKGPTVNEDGNEWKSVEDGCPFETDFDAVLGINLSMNDATASVQGNLRATRDEFVVCIGTDENNEFDTGPIQRCDQFRPDEHYRDYCANSTLPFGQNASIENGQIGFEFADGILGMDLAGDTMSVVGELKSTPDLGDFPPGTTTTLRFDGVRAENSITGTVELNPEDFLPTRWSSPLTAVPFP